MTGALLAYPAYTQDQRKKISLFCNVSIDDVIETVDVKTIYEAPISFNKEKLDERVLKFFKIKLIFDSLFSPAILILQS